MPFSLHRPPICNSTSGLPHRYLLIVLLFLLYSSHSFSQESKTDTIPYFLQTIYSRYMMAVGRSANLYNGSEYEGSYRLMRGSPFWNSNDFQNGVICYEGILYSHVPIAYDLVRNEVVIKDLQEQRVKLEKAKVDYFILNGHTFINLRNDSAAQNPLPDAIYDLLIDDPKIQLYAERMKVTQPALHADEPDSFVSHSKYYLQYTHTNYPLSGASDFLRIFHDEKTELKAFWKKHHLNFKKDPEAFIIQTLSFWLEENK